MKPTMKPSSEDTAGKHSATASNVPSTPARDSFQRTHESSYREKEMKTMKHCPTCTTPKDCKRYEDCQRPPAKEKANDRLGATACSLSLLNAAARRYRKEHFQRANADPTDTEAREAYHYEEGRTRAYSEGLNALDDQRAIARQRIEALKDHCREVNPTWAWLMREVLEIVDPQSPENADVEPPSERKANG